MGSVGIGCGIRVDKVTGHSKAGHPRDYMRGGKEEREVHIKQII